MGLREEHKELTRRKVLGAVLDLVAEGSLDALSVPAVSRRSGVSLATLYRYFPTKSDLLSAAAAEPSRKALAGTATNRDRPSADGNDRDGDDLAVYLRAMWSSFADNLPLLRHQIASETGRAMRQARTESSRSQLARYVENHGVEPDSIEGQRLISLLLLVNGSLALVELHDRQDLSVEDAVEHASWAARALIAATNLETGPLRPDR